MHLIFTNHTSVDKENGEGGAISPYLVDTYSKFIVIMGIKRVIVIKFHRKVLYTV